MMALNATHLRKQYLTTPQIVCACEAGGDKRGRRVCINEQTTNWAPTALGRGVSAHHFPIPTIKW